MQKKRLGWQIMLLMFMAAISTGNVFAPAPAEARVSIANCSEDIIGGLFGVCCRFDNMVQPDDFDFGSIPSSRIAGASQPGDVHWGCIGLGGIGSMRVCGTWEPLNGSADIANGHRLMRGAAGTLAEGHSIAFDFYDGLNASGAILGARSVAGLGVVPMQQANINILGAYFTQNTTGIILPNQPPVPAGEYSTPIMFFMYFSDRLIGGNWTGTCVDMDKNWTSSNRVAKVTVTNICDVNADNLDFGRFSALTKPRYTRGDIRVTCTMLLPYSVTVTSLNNLEMQGSNGGTLPYELFTNSNHTNKWEMGRPEMHQSLDGYEQIIPIYAKLAPSEQRLKPGEYTDTLTVTVTY